MKKFENFCNALINLEKINDYSEPYDTVVLTGLVGLFEICFEQAWKAMKEILEDNGFSEGRTGSPKQILKTAYSAGMIDDEEMWLKALQSCNNVTHSYNEDIALDIVRSARECYYGLFKQLEAEIKDNFL